MEFGSVSCARSHKLSRETVVVYASVRKPGFAYRFSYLEKERKESSIAVVVAVNLAAEMEPGQ